MSSPETCQTQERARHLPSQWRVPGILAQACLLLSALTVSIPWEADAQGHTCRSGSAGWTEAEGPGEELAPDRCGHSPSFFPYTSPGCRGSCCRLAAVLKIPREARLHETEHFLQPRKHL